MQQLKGGAWAKLLSGFTQDPLECRTHILQQPGFVDHDDDVRRVLEQCLESSGRLTEVSFDLLSSRCESTKESDGEHDADKAEGSEAHDQRLTDEARSQSRPH